MYDSLTVFSESTEYLLCKKQAIQKKYMITHCLEGIQGPNSACVSSSWAATVKSGRCRKLMKLSNPEMSISISLPRCSEHQKNIFREAAAHSQNALQNLIHLLQDMQPWLRGCVSARGPSPVLTWSSLPWLSRGGSSVAEHPCWDTRRQKGGIKLCMLQGWKSQAHSESSQFGVFFF